MKNNTVLKWLNSLGMKKVVDIITFKKVKLGRAYVEK